MKATDGPTHIWRLRDPLPSPPRARQARGSPSHLYWSRVEEVNKPWLASRRTKTESSFLNARLSQTAAKHRRSFPSPQNTGSRRLPGLYVPIRVPQTSKLRIARKRSTWGTSLLLQRCPGRCDMGGSARRSTLVKALGEACAGLCELLRSNERINSNSVGGGTAARGPFLNLTN